MREANALKGVDRMLIPGHLGGQSKGVFVAAILFWGLATWADCRASTTGVPAAASESQPSFGVRRPARRVASSAMTTLYYFGYREDGANPSSNLIADANGNLYGTTLNGGNPDSDGAVFELSAPASGGGLWSEQLIHVFDGDGQNPYGGLVADARGSLYGTSRYTAYGTVFELDPPASAKNAWNFTTILDFDGPWNFRLGCSPIAGLIFDRNGVLYGTTSACGTGAGEGGGTVFSLSGPPAGHANWTTKRLYAFGQNSSSDPTQPLTNLALDPNGNLYGTGYAGGAYGGGGIFRISPNSYGWTETNLHQFAGPTGGSAGDGQNGGGLLWRDGTLYGTTSAGGAYGQGTVFAINRWSGTWVETVIYSFRGSSDGAAPMSSLIADANWAALRHDVDRGEAMLLRPFDRLWNRL